MIRAVGNAVRNGFRALSGNAEWDESCPGGEPVQAEHKCESSCCPSRPVATLEEGTMGVVSCLTDPEHPRAARLASLGILPGVPVRVVQTYPAFVLRMGYTEIALDRDLACLVRVITGAQPS
ncbi:MAG: FeoA family protein [Gemmatimonadota bacterium]